MSKRALVVVLLVVVACKGAKPEAPRLPTPGSAPPASAGSGSAAAAPAKPAPPDDKQVLPLDPTVRHGTLPNGLTYYVKANRQPEQRVQLWLAVNAGSVQETDEQRGLAHMVEHLAFEGTKRFPKHDIQHFIERAGMKFGADLNAYTSFDETVYQLVVPSADVDRGLDVLRDWASDITFDPKEVVEERKIIEEERRFRNSVGFRLLQQIIPVEYAGSKYAHRLPIGTTEVIKGATADKLLAYYKAWYRPDLQAVIVVGDIDAAAIEKQIKDRFGSVPAAPATAPERTETAVETKHAPRFTVARDREQALFQVSINYQMPHRPEATAGDFRRGLVELLFSKLLDDRLDIISKRGTSPWSSAGVEFDTDLRPVDELQLKATAKSAAKVKDALAGLAGELARVRQHGFDKDELAAGRAEILQHLEETVKEADTRESSKLADEYLRHFLTQEAAAGPHKELELARAYLPTIKNAELVALAQTMVGHSRVVTVLAPLAGAVAAEKELADAIAAAEGKTYPVWEPFDLTAPLIAADPAPGKVTGEKALVEGVTQWTLSNGARVFLKPTAFKKDEVTIVAVSNGGTSVVADKDYFNALNSASIVNASGVGNYGAEELKRKLAGKKVGVEMAINDEQERVSGTASPADLEPLAQLMYGAFVEPRRDEAAFAAWKTQQQQIVDLVAANSQGQFIVRAFAYLFNNNLRIPLPFPTKASIDGTTLDGALAQYKARFANAADFAFVIVGAFDPAKVRPLVEKYFASLPATKAKPEMPADTGLRFRKGTVAQTMKIGSEDKSMSLLVTWAPVPWSLTVEADANVLSRVLDLELLAVLREKLGGTYTVTVQSDASRNPPQQAATLVLFESAPANAKAMQEETWRSLDRIATSPVSDDTLAKVREQIKKEHDTNRGENSYWSSSLVRVARYGDDLATVLDVSRVTSRVTKDQVQQTARTFVDKTNRATFTLLPEK
ncbi:MAG: insulinase family protein [Deltaproteobacteria bacterium]|nr:insulinase family protein [Deltaproteobacteria bacterium]